MPEGRDQGSGIRNDAWRDPPQVSDKRQGVAEILISDLRSLSSDPGSGAAACASLLPRIQRTDVRDQKRSLALAFPALRERRGLTEVLISDL